MFPAGFEPAVPTIERAWMHATSGIGLHHKCFNKNPLPILAEFKETLRKDLFL
jgi:hypothetical protein